MVACSGKHNPYMGTEIVTAKGRNKMQNNQRSNTTQDVSAKDMIDIINKRGTHTSKNENVFRLMISIVKGESFDDHYWLSGYGLGGIEVKRKPRETVRVRLNTVEERVMDEKSFSNKSEALIQAAVKQRYITNSNRRKTLQEHIQGSTRMISFERVTYLYTKDNVKHYRAHWSTAMSSSPHAQFIQGMGHVRIIQPDERIDRKATCQAEIIESMTLAAGREDAEDNNLIIAKALNNNDPTSQLDSAERTGKLMVEMVRDGERNTRTIDIYSEKKEVEAVSATGEKIMVRRAIPYAETIQAYLSGEDFYTKLYKADPNNAYRRDKAFDADINRHILGYLLGIDAKTIPIIRDDIADTIIKPFVNSLYKKEVVLNLFAVRIYQYGSRYRAEVLSSTAKQKLHQNYVVAINEGGSILPYHETDGLPATPAYAPTALAVQRYDDGTAYVVFEGAVDIRKDRFVLSSAIEQESVASFKDFFGVVPKA